MNLASTFVVLSIIIMDSALSLAIRHGPSCSRWLHLRQWRSSVGSRWMLSGVAGPPLRHERLFYRRHDYLNPELHKVGRRARSGLYLYENKRQQCSSDATKLHLSVPTADDMEEIGALVASITLLDNTASSAAGEVVFLQGDLGAGKTAFARGFLRAATGDRQLRVTSPTYLLSNTYLATAAEGFNQNLE
jgi:Threonylcarbamoyl adenosine biosynthesis protein TsaE